MANFNAVPYHDAPETINQTHSNPSPTAPRTTWEAFANADASHCVAVVYKGDRLVTAGVIKSFSANYEIDGGIVLTRCDDIMAGLDREFKLVGKTVATYYNMKDDVKIELREASAFFKDKEAL